MWKPHLTLTNDVRRRVLDLARETKTPVAAVLAELITDGLGMHPSEVQRNQLAFDLGEPEWLEQLRLRHVG